MAESDHSDSSNTDQPAGNYSVVAAPSTVETKPDGTVELGVYVIGHGEVAANQLDVLHRDPELRTEESGSAEFRAQITPNGEVVTGETAESAFDHAEEIGETGTKLSFPGEFFTETKREPDNFDFPVRLLDDNHDGGPPIRYTLPVASDAPPGTYEVRLVFTYLTDDVVKQDRTTVPVRVRSFRERAEPWPTWATILAGLIALVSLVVTALGPLGDVVSTTLDVLPFECCREIALSTAALGRVRLARFVELLSDTPT